MDWTSFINSVEEESPGEAVVQATIQWFADKLKASKPSMAEGFTEAAVESVLPSDVVVQACCRRIIRAVEAVSKPSRSTQRRSQQRPMQERLGFQPADWPACSHL